MFKDEKSDKIYTFKDEKVLNILQNGNILRKSGYEYSQEGLYGTFCNAEIG